MGARTDAARTAAVASRGELVEQVARLEAAAREAVDIPAKVRRAPGRTAGLAAGAAFVAVGGPRRVLRRLNRAVRGPQADLPKSMLPDQVERTLKRLGSDGDKVRGTLEREFAAYLDATAAERRGRDLSGTVSLLAGSVLGPVTKRLGRQLAEELFTPKAAGSGPFGDALKQARERWTGPTSPGGRAPAEPSGEATAPGKDAAG